MNRIRIRPTHLLCLSLLLAACDTSAPPKKDAGGADRAVDGRPVDHGTPLDGKKDIPSPDLITDAAPACSRGASRCLSPGMEEVCIEKGGQLAWVQRSCVSGERCLDQRCSDSCADVCNLHQTRQVNGKTETCELYSVASDGFVSLSDGMHDRARRYNAWLRRWHQPAGGLNDARFKDTTYKELAGVGGTGDSALWTGSYLAAEALRYKATGSADARENVRKMVGVMHRLFAITGNPGYLARFAAPFGADPLLDRMYQGSKDHPDFHTADYDGKKHFYRTGTSRDAYQGILWGYAHAYQALTSEPHREVIRKDIVTLCMELIKERSITFNVRFYFLDQWINVPAPMKLQYILLNPQEYVDGAPTISLGTEEDPTDIESSELRGFREFFPDYAMLVKQVPLLNSLPLPGFPRSGSTIMLAAILRIGLLVTKDVPAYQAQYAAIKAHYDQNFSYWLKILDHWFYGFPKCMEKYYGLNITMMPAHTVMRLEDDPIRKRAFQSQFFIPKIWELVKGHKNVFFNYIHASQAPASVDTKALVAESNRLLGLFPPPPNAERTLIDNTQKYGKSDTCDEITVRPLELPDRQIDYFTWQKNPFKRVIHGSPTHVWPGVDYLLPYWLARANGLIADDAKGRCLRWH